MIHLENTHGVFIYDELGHVPLIWPGACAAKRVIKPSALHWICFPTVAEFLSLSADASRAVERACGRSLTGEADDRQGLELCLR